MARIWVIKDGDESNAKMFDCRIENNVPKIKVGDGYYTPLGNGAIVERLGLGKLTPQMIIKNPEIWLHMGINEGGREVITQEEMQQRSKARYDAEARALEAACPGINKLKAAINDVERYHREFNRMMDDEGNDGARPPRAIQGDVDALRKQYPVAAAYLKAESWSFANHYAKAGAGSRAMDRIVAGEDHIQVLTDMEREWSDHCNAHIWD